MDTEKLKNRDYVLVIDKSGSMEERDCPNNLTRWAYMEESVRAIASKLQEYDPDGITVIPFAGDHRTYENTRDDVVNKIFKENSPMGGTTLAPVLREVFDTYNRNKKAGNTKPNGQIVMVVTDGCPQDEAAVARSIVDFTKTLADGREEFGIEFVQIGRDQHAKEFLGRLDNNLSQEGAKYDIVNATTMEEVEKVGLVETLIASLTK